MFAKSSTESICETVETVFIPVIRLACREKASEMKTDILIGDN